MSASYIAIYIAVFYLLIFIPALEAKNRRKRRRQREKKGEKRLMPTELINEFIGKKVILQAENLGSISGVIVAVEGSWLKVDEKNCIRLVNGDMISHIKLAKEKK